MLNFGIRKNVAGRIGYGSSRKSCNHAVCTFFPSWISGGGSQPYASEPDALGLDLRSSSVTTGIKYFVNTPPQLECRESICCFDANTGACPGRYGLPSTIAGSYSSKLNFTSRSAYGESLSSFEPSRSIN